MAFFSEHSALPESAQFEVDQNTHQARASRAPTRGDPEWVREIETEIIMSLSFARSLRGWLDDKIKTMESVDSSEAFQIVEFEPPQTGEDAS